MALDTYNRSLVPNHPSIAALLNNYGVLYEHKGEYDKAVAMHEQVYRNGACRILEACWTFFFEACYIFMSHVTYERVELHMNVIEYEYD